MGGTLTSSGGEEVEDALMSSSSDRKRADADTTDGGGKEVGGNDGRFMVVVELCCRSDFCFSMNDRWMKKNRGAEHVVELLSCWLISGYLGQTSPQCHTNELTG